MGGACLWRFAGDACCAKQARAALGSVMRELAFAADAIDDGVLAVSELATNSHRHASRLAASVSVAAIEMWVWARTHPRPELVVAIFDGFRDAAPIPASGQVLDEDGKGLGIVAALGTTWGWHHSRSRLVPRSLPGKATWFTLPLPVAWPVPCHLITPAMAAQRLHMLLCARGLAATRRGDPTGISVISTGSLDIWVRPGWFTWKNGSGYDRHPLLDLQEAAENAIKRVETSRR